MAARVLCDDGHAGATYELVGLRATSQTTVAQLLSTGLGTTITAATVDRETWRISAENDGLRDYAINTLLAMFVYYETHGMDGNSNVMRWLLGRAPRTLEAFAREAASDR